MSSFVHFPRLRSLQTLVALTGAVLLPACGEPADGAKPEPTATTSSTSVTPLPTGTTTGTPTAPTTSANTSTTTDASSSIPSSNSQPTSTGADSSSNAPTVATLDEIRDILLFRCGNLICHLPPPYTPPNFGESGDALYTLLTTFTVEKCAGSALIVPGDTENSAILKVVNHGCGEFYMPPDTYDSFTAEELATLTAWVEAGAPK